MSRRRGDVPKKEEKDQEELEIKEEIDFKSGPLSLLNDSVQTQTQVMISCRNNKKLFARVKAFDRHCNMILENVKEVWTEMVRSENTEKAKPVNKTRFISKMFLRGDSIIVVVKSTKTRQPEQESNPPQQKQVEIKAQ